jgi:hypothetical protein
MLIVGTNHRSRCCSVCAEIIRWNPWPATNHRQRQQIWQVAVRALAGFIRPGWRRCVIAPMALGRLVAWAGRETGAARARKRA